MIYSFQFTPAKFSYLISTYKQLHLQLANCEVRHEGQQVVAGDLSRELAVHLFLFIASHSAENYLVSLYLNPLALRLSLESIVCFSHIFENNFWIKQKFKKNLRGGLLFAFW